MADANMMTLTPAAIGALPLATAVNQVVGTTATVLTKPSGAQFLVLVSDQGGFRIRRGSVAGAMPATEFPAASVADGSGGIYLGDSRSLVLACFSEANYTIKGYNAVSCLTYYWL